MKKSSFITTLLLCAAALFSSFATATESQQVVAEQSVLKLISDHQQAQPGQTITIGWRINLTPHWHVYWHNAGDSGLPPELNWTLPPGWSISSIQGWPTPLRLDIPPLVNYGYEDELILLYELSIPQHAAPGTYHLQTHAGLLMCKDVCIPGEGTLELPVNVGSSSIAKQDVQQQFANVRTQYAQPWAGAPLSFSITEDTMALQLPAGTKTAYFYPAQEGIINDTAAQKISKGNLLLKADVHRGMPSTLSGRLTLDGQDYWVNDIPMGDPAVADASSHNLLLIIALAFIAGIILNLMPCVLPVLMLKALSIIKKAHVAQPWRHGVAYTAGVVASFVGIALVLLSLKAAGAQLGWGFQLQSPLFVALLSLLLLLLAFNFFGFISFGQSLARLTPRDNGSVVSSALFGLLVTVLATPCTTPFMGGAVAVALTQGGLAAVLIFTSLGLGLALPFLLISLYPNLLQRVPQPGPWLEYFKQFLGFPLIATALWLLWVLGQQTSVNTLAFVLALALLLSLAMWMFNLLNQPTQSNDTRFGGWVILLAAVIGSVWAVQFYVPATSMPADQHRQHEQAWSPKAVEQALADGQIVFLNFTADWCITCKVNEHTTLKSADVRKLFITYNVQQFVGDWTRYDPAISQELERYGRQGVPLYVLMAAGKDPIVLPQLLTSGEIRKQLEHIRD